MLYALLPMERTHHYAQSAGDNLDFTQSRWRCWKMLITSVWSASLVMVHSNLCQRAWIDVLSSVSPLISCFLPSPQLPGRHFLPSDKKERDFIFLSLLFSNSFYNWHFVFLFAVGESSWGEILNSTCKILKCLSLFWKKIAKMSKKVHACCGGCWDFFGREVEREGNNRKKWKGLRQRVERKSEE